LLASGYSPIYPCHISPRDTRTHPIGTGPFKFAEFKPNELIRVVRNPNYWKPGRPYLDGIEYTIVPNRSTAMLAFTAGKFDMTWPYIVTIPLLRLTLIRSLLAQSLAVGRGRPARCAEALPSRLSSRDGRAFRRTPWPTEFADSDDIHRPDIPP